jgi:probable HAF family extracellular repeat protein
MKISFSLALAITLAPTLRASAQTYTIVDLGTLGGRHSHALGINASNIVVGYSSILFDAAYRATLWQDAAPVNLGRLPNKTDSFAGAVNASVHVVGNSSSAIYYNRRAFLWTPDSGMQDLGTLGDSRAQSSAQGINSSDRIVGWSTLRGDPAARHAFVYADGTMTDLGIGTAYAVSEDGVVVGDNGTHAVVWYETDTYLDLGTLGGDRSSARGINEWGLVVGNADEGPEDSHAFIWDPVNGMSNLGTLGGAFSIANAMSGTIAVGQSQTWAGAYHAMLYDLNGPGDPVDLNDLLPPDSGWVLTTATGINACGAIVGDGMINGQDHAFLLIPDSSCDAPRKANVADVRARAAQK